MRVTFHRGLALIALFASNLIVAAEPIHQAAKYQNIDQVYAQLQQEADNEQRK